MQDLDRRRFLLGAVGLGAGALGLTACASDDRPTLADAPTAPTSGQQPTAGAGQPAVDPTPMDTATPTPLPLPEFLDSGPLGPAVALTFHVDGDPGIATALLDILREKDTQITAFLIGYWVDDNPELAQRFVREGHEVANHTYNHQDMGAFNLTQIVDEYERCALIMDEILGDRGQWARPSAIDVPTPLMIEAARIAGYRSTIGFNTDPLDYRDPGVEAIRAGTVDNLQGGEIISLHFGHQQTVDAMPAIIDGIGGRGLRAATVSELLGVAR